LWFTQNDSIPAWEIDIPDLPGTFGTHLKELGKITDQFYMGKINTQPADLHVTRIKQIMKRLGISMHCARQKQNEQAIFFHFVSNLLKITYIYPKDNFPISGMHDDVYLLGHRS
jgi:hypothetical protein